MNELEENKVLKEDEKVSIFVYGSPKEIVISEEKIMIHPSTRMYVWNYEQLKKPLIPKRRKPSKSRVKIEKKLKEG